MIATISPSCMSYHETINTLRYANRSKAIINCPIVNEDPHVREIRELRGENSRLRRALALSHMQYPLVNGMKHENITDVVSMEQRYLDYLFLNWLTNWHQDWLRANEICNVVQNKYSDTGSLLQTCCSESPSLSSPLIRSSSATNNEIWYSFSHSDPNIVQYSDETLKITVTQSEDPDSNSSGESKCSLDAKLTCINGANNVYRTYRSRVFDCSSIHKHSQRNGKMKTRNRRSKHPYKSVSPTQRSVKPLINSPPVDLVMSSCKPLAEGKDPLDWSSGLGDEVDLSQLYPNKLPIDSVEDLDKVPTKELSNIHKSQFAEDLLKTPAYYANIGILPYKCRLLDEEGFSDDSLEYPSKASPTPSSELLRSNYSSSLNTPRSPQEVTPREAKVTSKDDLLGEAVNESSATISEMPTSCETRRHSRGKVRRDLEDNLSSSDSEEDDNKARKPKFRRKKKDSCQTKHVVYSDSDSLKESSHDSDEVDTWDSSESIDGYQDKELQKSRFEDHFFNFLKPQDEHVTTYSDANYHDESYYQFSEDSDRCDVIEIDYGESLSRQLYTIIEESNDELEKTPMLDFSSDLLSLTDVEPLARSPIIRSPKVTYFGSCQEDSFTEVTLADLSHVDRSRSNIEDYEGDERHCRKADNNVVVGSDVRTNSQCDDIVFESSLKTAPVSNQYTVKTKSDEDVATIYNGEIINTVSDEDGLMDLPSEDLKTVSGVDLVEQLGKADVINTTNQQGCPPALDLHSIFTSLRKTTVQACQTEGLNQSQDVMNPDIRTNKRRTVWSEDSNNSESFGYSCGGFDHCSSDKDSLVDNSEDSDASIESFIQKMVSRNVYGVRATLQEFCSRNSSLVNSDSMGDPGSFDNLDDPVNEFPDKEPICTVPSRDDIANIFKRVCSSSPPNSSGENLIGLRSNYDSFSDEWKSSDSIDFLFKPQIFTTINPCRNKTELYENKSPNDNINGSDSKSLNHSNESITVSRLESENNLYREQQVLYEIQSETLQASQSEIEIDFGSSQVWTEAPFIGNKDVGPNLMGPSDFTEEPFSILQTTHDKIGSRVCDGTEDPASLFEHLNMTCCIENKYIPDDNNGEAYKSDEIDPIVSSSFRNVPTGKLNINEEEKFDNVSECSYVTCLSECGEKIEVNVLDLETFADDYPKLVDHSNWVNFELSSDSNIPVTSVDITHNVHLEGDVDNFQMGLVVEQQTNVSLLGETISSEVNYYEPDHSLNVTPDCIYRVYPSSESQNESISTDSSDNGLDRDTEIECVPNSNHSKLSRNPLKVKLNASRKSKSLDCYSNYASSCPSQKTSKSVNIGYLDEIRNSNENEKDDVTVKSSLNSIYSNIGLSAAVPVESHRSTPYEIYLNSCSSRGYCQQPRRAKSLDSVYTQIEQETILASRRTVPAVTSQVDLTKEDTFRILDKGALHIEGLTARGRETTRTVTSPEASALDQKPLDTSRNNYTDLDIHGSDKTLFADLSGDFLQSHSSIDEISPKNKSAPSSPRKFYDPYPLSGDRRCASYNNMNKCCSASFKECHNWYTDFMLEASSLLKSIKDVSQTVEEQIKKADLVLKERKTFASVECQTDFPEYYMKPTDKSNLTTSRQNESDIHGRMFDSNLLSYIHYDHLSPQRLYDHPPCCVPIPRVYPPYSVPLPYPNCINPQQCCEQMDMLKSMNSSNCKFDTCCDNSRVPCRTDNRLNGLQCGASSGLCRHSFFNSANWESILHSHHHYRQQLLNIRRDIIALTKKMS